MESTSTTTSQPALKIDAPTDVESKTQKRSSTQWNKLVVIISLVILAAFAIFVWPARYQYEHVQGNHLVRIDRFTGEVSYLDLAKEGWQSLNPQKEEKVKTDLIYRPSPSSSPYQVKLPVQFQEIAPFVDGSARDSSDNRKNCELYMDGNVVIFDSNGKRLTDKDISASLSLAQMTCKNLYGEKGH